MSIHENIVPYDKNWPILYKGEAENIKKVFGKDLVHISHIGSTSIPGLASKPIIDIAVLISSYEKADKYIELLSKLGYEYDKPKSSPERHFLRKYGDGNYHLSIAFQDRGSFWERQTKFRDYLIVHEDVRKEYELLKAQLLAEDPTGKGAYFKGKGEFVNKILSLAGFTKIIES